MSYAHSWTSENYLSYQVVDRLLWLSLERDINQFRTKKLGLEAIRAGQSGSNILNYHQVATSSLPSHRFLMLRNCSALLQVPFVKMWSPALAPKPKDWPSHVDVVGTFFPSARSVSEGAGFLSPSEFVLFLESTSKPIVYVGFGSMVLEDLQGVLALFLQAAAMLNVRIVVQMGWTEVSNDRFRDLALTAQQQAEIIRDTESFNDMNKSAIFPQTKRASASHERAADTSRPRLPAISPPPAPTPGEGSSQPFLGGWLLGALSLGAQATSAVLSKVSRSDAESMLCLMLPSLCSRLELQLGLLTRRPAA
jgi:hypothetical protein